MNTVNNEKKVDILISALEERYDSIHRIRDRVQTTSVWILGILTSISGWLIQSKVSLTCSEKCIYIIGLAIVFCLIRFVYFKDLNKGFKGQQKMAAKLESALGFYEPKYFMDDVNSIYPKTWVNAGTENGEGKFFQSTYYLIYAGFVFLFIALLLAPITTELPTIIFIR
ncbi:MAG: hypothetical protein V4576_00855 [Patescibacteria group bacterium]